LNSITSEESKLVSGLIEGKRAAAEQLIRTHQQWMQALAKCILNDDALAEDCVQESFISAIQKVASFQGRSSFKAWLKRIVINNCLMKLRHQKRRNEINVDDFMPVFDDNDFRIEPNWSSIKTPEAVLQDHQNSEQILKHINQLPDDYRVVLLLRDIEELSTKEAASALNCSEGIVKVRLHRARSALKKMLEPIMSEAGEKPSSIMRNIKGNMLRYTPGLITCAEFEQFIDDYLDNNLSGKEIAVFERHLKLCRECRDYLTAYQHSITLGKAVFAVDSDDLPVPDEIPADLLQAILEAKQ
jgi:RNA polymerase sigma-70 factor (ECF subfamily)